MPTRTDQNKSGAPLPVADHFRPARGRRLKVAAQSTLFAAGLAAARLVAESSADQAGTKLFSPGLVDRLKAPITRFHD
jgi:hypothetical protein